MGPAPLGRLGAALGLVGLALAYKQLRPPSGRLLRASAGGRPPPRGISMSEAGRESVAILAQAILAQAAFRPRFRALPPFLQRRHGLRVLVLAAAGGGPVARDLRELAPRPADSCCGVQRGRRAPRALGGARMASTSTCRGTPIALDSCSWSGVTAGAHALLRLGADPSRTVQAVVGAASWGNTDHLETLIDVGGPAD